MPALTRRAGASSPDAPGSRSPIRPQQGSPHSDAPGGDRCPGRRFDGPSPYGLRPTGLASHGRPAPSHRRPHGSQTSSPPTLTHISPTEPVGGSRRHRRGQSPSSGLPSRHLPLHSPVPELAPWLSHRSAVRPPGCRPRRAGTNHCWTASPARRRHIARGWGIRRHLRQPVDAVLLVAVGVLLAVFPDAPGPRPPFPARWRWGRSSPPCLATALRPTGQGVRAVHLADDDRRARPGVTADLCMDASTRSGPTLHLRQVLPWMAVFVTLGLFEPPISCSSPA
jgi:hypothetical protein